MVLPGGRLLSAIPQRCICRQSNIGAASSNECRLDVAQLFAVKDAEGDLRRLLALSGNDLHWTTDDALSEKGLVVKKDRCVGYAIKP